MENDPESNELRSSKHELRSHAQNADQRIELCLFYGRSALDLCRLVLKAIPSAVYGLTHLESLLARNNQLKSTLEEPYISIQPEISQLKALTVLDLGYNGLSIVPDAIFDLVNLESLILNNNKLESLNPLISNLTKLKTLHLGANILEHLPDEIGALTNLESLIAPSNQLKSLPAAVCELRSLDDIYLRHNDLTEFPKCLLPLEKLAIVSIEDNRIVKFNTELPPNAQVLHSVPQEVLPNIYIGSASTSKNRRSLILCQITYHICLSDPVGTNSPPHSSDLFEHDLCIQLLDNETQVLKDTIDNCNVFIEEAVRNGSKILVNSTLGVSRSAAIVCAYMIKHLKIPYSEAIAKLRKVRSYVKPNAGFEQQLKEYEKSILESSSS